MTARSPHAYLQQRYDSFWRAAERIFRRGGVQVDPYLANKSSDLRRGLTLLARPGPMVQDSVSGFLKDVAGVDPGLYFYQPPEFHVTILTLLSASENSAPGFAKLPLIQSVLQSDISQAEAFTLHFMGITASPEAVLVQGFPQSGALEHLRERLRVSFRKAGLGDMLDIRYRIETAHMTVIRFQTQPRDLPGLIKVLKRYRQTEFGQTSIQILHLVCNDWYMSSDKVTCLNEYRLGKTPI